MDSHMTTSKIIVYVVFAAATVAACGKSKKPETAPADIGSTGYVVDVPAGWTVKMDMDRFYSVEGAGGSGPQIIDQPSGSPGTLDVDIKNLCDGRTDVHKDAIGKSGYWYTCKGESKMMKGVVTTKIAAIVPRDGQGFFDCHLETDEDPAQALAICKSIHKK